MPTKLLYADVETTGTDPEKHGIIQLAAILEIDGEEVDSFTSNCNIHKGDEITEEALDVNGLTQLQIASFPDPAGVKHKFERFLAEHVDRFDRADKCYLVGYNGTFDDEFLRAWFAKCGDKYYGSWICWPPIDVAVLAAVHFMIEGGREKLHNFKLGTVARALGIAAP